MTDKPDGGPSLDDMLDMDNEIAQMLAREIKSLQRQVDCQWRCWELAVEKRTDMSDSITNVGRKLDTALARIAQLENAPASAAVKPMRYRANVSTTSKGLAGAVNVTVDGQESGEGMDVVVDEAVLMASKALAKAPPGVPLIREGE